MTPASERTVFVVDDDAAALDSLVLLLRSDGLNPSGFSSAHAFLEALSPNARGCVISDVRMPGMDGVQLLRHLKQIGCILPVIVITGHADVTVAVQAMKAGAAEFIQRPFESEQILRLVRACLEENDEALGVYRFFGLPTPPKGEIARTLQMEANPKSIDKHLVAQKKCDILPQFEACPAEIQATLRRICGPMAERLGYHI